MNPIGTVVVFAGAGASKAIDPEKYPTTVEFFQRLPSGVTADPLFVEVRKFLENEAGTGRLVDIELLLWRLGELQNFCSAARDRNSMTGWMIKGNRLAATLGLKNYNFGNLEQIAVAAADKIRDLITRIHAQVYDLYGQLPEPQQLESTWKQLIEPLLRSGATLEIVTTNYDMILEVALDELNASASLPVDTGWRGTVQRTLDTTLWTRRRETPSSSGLLTKLHGSVNWTRNGDTIYVSDPTYKGSDKRHVIIYPGFKGRPTDPVFQSFHNHFADCLSRAVAAVFIGFVFRDEHINDLCDRALPTSATLIVIDPAEVVAHPFRRANAVHLGKGNGFDASTARDAARIVEESLQRARPGA